MSLGIWLFACYGTLSILGKTYNLVETKPSDMIILLYFLSQAAKRTVSVAKIVGTIEDRKSVTNPLVSSDKNSKDKNKTPSKTKAEPITNIQVTRVVLLSPFLARYRNCLSAATAPTAMPKIKPETTATVTDSSER
jgi:hypothetical protein